MQPATGRGEGRPQSDANGLGMAIGRRQFIAGVAGAAAYTVLAPKLGWARRVARPWPQLQSWSLPDEPPPGLDTIRAMIGAAVLAPSQWNTQPWRYEVEGSTIRLVADATRAMPITDPARRGMMLSLGAGLENLLIAARAYGQRPTVEYLPAEGTRGTVAEVALSGGDPPRDRALFGVIPHRRTNRREYDGRAVTLASSAQLMAQTPDGYALHWLDDRGAIRDLGDPVYEAERASVRDRHSEAERFAWMRLDDGDARRRGDGVTLDELEIGGLARWFAGRYFDPSSRFLHFGAENAGKQARDQVRSSGALALITASRRSESAWIMGGQMIERFALKATSLGIAHHVMTTAIADDRTRPELMRAFGAAGEEPLALVRLGHAKPPAPSYRRAVALVSTYRNS